MFTANLAGSASGGAPHYLHHHHLRTGEHHQTGGSHTRLNYLPPPQRGAGDGAGGPGDPDHRRSSCSSCRSAGGGPSIFAQGGMFNKFDDGVADSENGGEANGEAALDGGGGGGRVSVSGSRNPSIASHQMHAVHLGVCLIRRRESGTDFAQKQLSNFLDSSRNIGAA